MIKKSGIYKVTSPTYKVYIGRTVNIFKRWNEHKNHLGIGPKLLNSYQKYGSQNHIFEIIEECSIDILDEREVYHKQQELDKVDGDFDKVLFCSLYDIGVKGEWPEYLKKKHSDLFKGRKITWKAGRKVGYKLSEEDKNKLRVPKSEETKQKMRRSRSEEGKHNMRVPKPNLQKPVYQYDLNNTFIKKWNSITEAYISFGKTINSSGITCCLKGKQKSTYGYIWKEN